MPNFATSDRPQLVGKSTRAHLQCDRHTHKPINKQAAIAYWHCFDILKKFFALIQLNNKETRFVQSYTE